MRVAASYRRAKPIDPRLVSDPISPNAHWAWMTGVTIRPVVARERPKRGPKPRFISGPADTFAIVHS